MSDPKTKPFRIVVLWLALLLPLVTVIALISLAQLASTSGFTEIAQPAAKP